jgi:hypothetical protein
MATQAANATMLDNVKTAEERLAEANAWLRENTKSIQGEINTSSEAADELARWMGFVKDTLAHSVKFQEDWARQAKQLGAAIEKSISASDKFLQTVARDDSATNANIQQQQQQQQKSAAPAHPPRRRGGALIHDEVQNTLQVIDISDDEDEDDDDDDD